MVVPIVGAVAAASSSRCFTASFSVTAKATVHERISRRPVWASATAELVSLGAAASCSRHHLRSCWDCRPHQLGGGSPCEYVELLQGVDFATGFLMAAAIRSWSGSRTSYLPACPPRRRCAGACMPSSQHRATMVRCRAVGLSGRDHPGARARDPACGDQHVRRHAGFETPRLKRSRSNAVACVLQRQPLRPFEAKRAGRASSHGPRKLITTPSPNFAWRTFWPIKEPSLVGADLGGRGSRWDYGSDRSPAGGGRRGIPVAAVAAASPTRPARDSRTASRAPPLACAAGSPMKRETMP